MRIDPGLVPERPLTCRRRRSGASARSIVAEDICRSFERVAGSSESSPWRSRAYTASAMNGASRLPEGPFNVAHTNRSGSRTSSP